MVREPERSSPCERRSRMHAPDATPRTRRGGRESRVPHASANRATRWPGLGNTGRMRRHGRPARRSDRSGRPARSHCGRSRRQTADRQRRSPSPSRRQSAPAPASPGRAGPRVSIFVAARASAEPFVRPATKHRGRGRVEVSSAAFLVQRNFLESCGGRVPLPPVRHLRQGNPPRVSTNFVYLSYGYMAKSSIISSAARILNIRCRK